MTSNQQIIEAIRKTIFLTPALAKKKQCFVYGAPSVQDDSDRVVTESIVATKNPCIAKDCMNWVDLGKVGFCIRSCTNKVMDSVMGFGTSDANR
jgi:hypothetical protein